MKKIIVSIIFIIAICNISNAQKLQDKKLSFLHTSNQDIVNENGEKIFLRGVGLGNWLLPEGYMWKFGENGDRPRKIEKIISDIIGEEKANLFWKKFRQEYITEADIKRIAELGFNSVRPALNAKLFLTEGENSVFLEEGFQLIDSLIHWCKKYNLYVILDMHGAPGGQTGQNIDDSPNDIPELFTDKKNQDKLVALWVKLAERYKDEPTVAAFDLLNEPLPENTGSAEKYKHLLVPLYQRITAEIRKVDSKHMITLEGYNWANNWSLFDKPFDDNVFYQFHFYCWAPNDHLGDINDYLYKRDELNTPVWVGETGEKNNTLYWSTSQLFIKNNIGFSFWPWKKLHTKNTPYSIKKPDNWDLISEYSEGKSKPNSAIAEKILNEFLENIKLKNCIYFEDVCNAIMTRVPAKIEAENYGHYGYSHSYFVKDTTTKSKQYRTNEPVKIILDKKSTDSNSSEQSVSLTKTEWVMYNFDCLENRNYKVTIRASGNENSILLLTLNDKITKRIKIVNTNFKEIKLETLNLNKGENSIKIFIKNGNAKIDWIKFE